MGFTRFMGQDKQFSTKKRHEHEFQKTGEQLIGTQITQHSWSAGCTWQNGGTQD